MGNSESTPTGAEGSEEGWFSSVLSASPVSTGAAEDSSSASLTAAQTATAAHDDRAANTITHFQLIEEEKGGCTLTPSQLYSHSVSPSSSFVTSVATAVFTPSNSNSNPTPQTPTQTPGAPPSPNDISKVVLRLWIEVDHSHSSHASLVRGSLSTPSGNNSSSILLDSKALHQFTMAFQPTDLHLLPEKQLLLVVDRTGLWLCPFEIRALGSQLQFIWKFPTATATNAAATGGSPQKNHHSPQKPLSSSPPSSLAPSRSPLAFRHKGLRSVSFHNGENLIVMGGNGHIHSLPLFEYSAAAGGGFYIGHSIQWKPIRGCPTPAGFRISLDPARNLLADVDYIAEDLHEKQMIIRVFEYAFSEVTHPSHHNNNSHHTHSHGHHGKRTALEGHLRLIARVPFRGDQLCPILFVPKSSLLIVSQKTEVEMFEIGTATSEDNVTYLVFKLVRRLAGLKACYGLDASSNGLLLADSEGHTFQHFQSDFTRAPLQGEQLVPTIAGLENTYQTPLKIRPKSLNPKPTKSIELPNIAQPDFSAVATASPTPTPGVTSPTAVASPVTASPGAPSSTPISPPDSSTSSSATATPAPGTTPAAATASVTTPIPSSASPRMSLSVSNTKLSFSNTAAWKSIGPSDHVRDIVSHAAFGGMQIWIDSVQDHRSDDMIRCEYLGNTKGNELHRKHPALDVWYWWPVKLCLLPQQKLLLVADAGGAGGGQVHAFSFSLNEKERKVTWKKAMAPLRIPNARSVTFAWYPTASQLLVCGDGILCSVELQPSPSGNDGAYIWGPVTTLPRPLEDIHHDARVDIKWYGFHQLCRMALDTARGLLAITRPYKQDITDHGWKVGVDIYRLEGGRNQQPLRLEKVTTLPFTGNGLSPVAFDENRGLFLVTQGRSIELFRIHAVSSVPGSPPTLNFHSIQSFCPATANGDTSAAALAKLPHNYAITGLSIDGDKYVIADSRMRVQVFAVNNAQ